MSQAKRQVEAEVARTGRVLVIGRAEALGADVSCALTGRRGLTLTRVDDALQAVGQLARGGACDLVVCHRDDLKAPPTSAARALWRVAPQARLVIVLPRRGEGDATQALAAGFHDYLIEPVDQATLRRTLAVYLGEPAGEAEAAESDVEASEPPGVESPAAQAVTSDPTRRDESPIAAANADEPPGDVDMLEMLLRQRPGVADVAGQIVAERSGITGLRHSVRREEIDAAHALAAVEFDGRAHGFLHAPPPATPRQLEPWAAWMGRWLALEARMGQLWDMALKDELTGAWNRRYFNQFLSTVLQRAQTERFQVTLMVFDIDDFKLYNDRYGHAAGDAILREAARLMKSVVREQDVVARIGGDEFAVIFWDAQAPRRPNSQHPDDVRKAAQRFQKAICEHRFPLLLEKAYDTLTISGGLAGFPWDGRTPEELLEQADRMAMRSKRQGKNALTFGPGASRVCGAE